MKYWGRWSKFGPTWWQRGVWDDIPRTFRALRSYLPRHASLEWRGVSWISLEGVVLLNNLLSWKIHRRYGTWPQSCGLRSYLFTSINIPTRCAKQKQRLFLVKGPSLATGKRKRNILATTIFNQPPPSFRIRPKSTPQIPLPLIHPARLRILSQFGFGNQKAVAGVHLVFYFWGSRFAVHDFGCNGVDAVGGDDEVGGDDCPVLECQRGEVGILCVDSCQW
jgi:hypothetical protein